MLVMRPAVCDVLVGSTHNNFSGVLARDFKQRGTRSPQRSRSVKERQLKRRGMLDLNHSDGGCSSEDHIIDIEPYPTDLCQMSATLVTPTVYVFVLDD